MESSAEKNSIKPESVVIQKPVNPHKSNVVYIGGYPEFWEEFNIWSLLVSCDIITAEFDFITIKIGWDNMKYSPRKNAIIWFPRMESAQYAVDYLDGIFVDQNHRISVTYKVRHGDVSQSGKVFVDGIKPSYIIKGKNKPIFDWHTTELQLRMKFAKFGDIYQLRINTMQNGGFLYDSKGFLTARIWYYNPDSAEMVKNQVTQLPTINKRQVVLKPEVNTSSNKAAEEKREKINLGAKAMH